MGIQTEENRTEDAPGVVDVGRCEDRERQGGGAYGKGERKDGIVNL